MSTHSYIRTLLGSVWDTNISILSSEIKTALPGKAFSVKATGTDIEISFALDLAPAEITTLDSVITAHQTSNNALVVAKNAKIVAIDEKTSELISNGFEYPPGSGVMFSLSASGQKNIMTMELAKDDPSFTYPIDYNSKDDQSKITLANATDVHNFFLSALGTARYHLDAGTALKDQVRAAATIADIDAIVDNR